MKIFKSPDGRLLQLADIERINKWTPEMPLIYIGDLREKRIPMYKKQYSAKFVQEVETYVNTILEDVAIPKLINALQSSDIQLRLQVAENFVQISQSNADLLKIALPHIETAHKEEKNKDIKTHLSNTLKNYKKTQKKKLTAKKRTKLQALTRKMRDLDRDYADGTVSDSDYLNQRKEFVKLQREIEIEEAIE